jgi:hypothetical protein
MSFIIAINGAWGHSSLRSIRSPSSFLQAGMPFQRIFSDLGMGVYG